MATEGTWSVQSVNKLRGVTGRIDQRDLLTITADLPSHRTTPVAREFTIKLIQANQRRRLEVKLQT